MGKETDIKKRIAITACLVFCMTAAVLIGARPENQTQEDNLDPADIVHSAEVVTDPAFGINEDENEVTVSAPENPESQASDNGGVSSGVNQSIQPDVTKPAKPPAEVKKDPAQSTNGKKAAETAKPGDKQNGKIYVQGFGWIDDIGEGKGVKVDGDGDINKQVGEM